MIAPAWGSTAVRMLIVATCSHRVLGQAVVGPSAITSYSGGGGRRHGGYGYVREPAEGFFVAGSSIRDMNGVYVKVERVPSAINHVFHYAYRKFPIDQDDDLRGWQMALVKAPGPDAGYEMVNPNKKSEWLFIDPSFKDRFGHEGDTVIPGAGTKWKHLHRSNHPGAASSETTDTAALSVGDDDDLDELPWQIIFIGDKDQVEEFRRREAEYHANIRKAAIGENLAGKGPRCSNDPRPGVHCPSEEAPPVDFPGPDLLDFSAAAEAFLEARYVDAALAYSELLAAEKSRIHWQSQSVPLRRWRLAVLHLRMAEAWRRGKKFSKALNSIALAIQHYPRYKEAWLERGKVMLDAGKPSVGQAVLEQLLDVDRNNQEVLSWLVRCHANRIRAETAGEDPYMAMLKPGPSESEAELLAAVQRTGWNAPATARQMVDHYAILDVAVDFSADELKRSYKALSKSTHPDRNGGSNEAFQKVAAAYETLGDDARRLAYDRGDDVARPTMTDGREGPSLWERVERHYYPERYGLHIFGDPHEGKQRDVDMALAERQRRRDAAEAAETTRRIQSENDRNKQEL